MLEKRALSSLAICKNEQQNHQLEGWKDRRARKSLGLHTTDHVTSSARYMVPWKEPGVSSEHNQM